MAYRTNNNGCGCLVAIIVVMAIMSGIRSCTEDLINGDLKLPKFGSSHVGGGPGNYGTSNGYNVKYKQTTTPNTNNSLQDYLDTNNQPTDYREGKKTNNSNTNTVGTSSSHSINISRSSSTNVETPETYYKTCDWCKGTGKRNTFYLFNENVMGISCYECGRTDLHRHDEVIECEVCSGQGKIKMERVNGPLGEMEMRVFE